jgi:nucleoside-diphosphate-sugar epimerase
MMYIIYSVFLQKYLVFGGKTGWIGGQLVEMLEKAGKAVVSATSRLENLGDIQKVATKH